MKAITKIRLLVAVVLWCLTAVPAGSFTLKWDMLTGLPPGRVIGGAIHQAGGSGHSVDATNRRCQWDGCFRETCCEILEH